MANNIDMSLAREKRTKNDVPRDAHVGSDTFRVAHATAALSIRISLNPRTARPLENVVGRAKRHGVRRVRTATVSQARTCAAYSYL